MGLETINEDNTVEVLTPDQSAQALLSYASIESEDSMNLTEVNDWLVDFYKLEKKDPDIIWKYNETFKMGVGFVNTEIGDLKVGIYFQHRNWREGKVCRANNQIDLKVFLDIATEIRNEKSNN